MRVNNVKITDVTFGLEKMPDERSAHFLDFICHVRAEVVRAKMVPHAVNSADAAGSVARPGKDVDLVPAPIQGCGQFGDMGCDPANRVRMQRLPRKHRDLHATANK